MRIFRVLFRHYPIVLYLSLFSLVFSLKIIAHPYPFFDWDESIYAQVGREMMETKSYFVPLWQGDFWLDKPPLVPLFYGIVMSITPFLLPEISTRLATLFLSVFALGLMYQLYWRVVRETWLTTTMIIATSLTSIFLQRAQVLNVDIFLLIGWIGYFLFRKYFMISLVFLGIAVYSKSLIGLYPLGILVLYHTYQYARKQITLQDLGAFILRMSLQALVLLSWHMVMIYVFGQEFLYKHFYESHVKRVTASIESHFGQRTFYITLLVEQYGSYALVSILGAMILAYQWFTKKISDSTLLRSLYFIPWFLFLNLTKTKIFWYGHPYLGQFAFLMLYPVTLLRKYGLFYFGIIAIILFSILNFHFRENTVLDDFYSSEEDHHKIARFAKDKCDRLSVIIPPEGRTAEKTLRDMNLLISTSRWWGNHPSMVYYFQGPVEFVYDEARIEEVMSTKSSCVALSKDDIIYIPGQIPIMSLDRMNLYQ